MKFILILFVVWRIFLFSPLYFSDKSLPYRQNYEYTSLLKEAKTSPVVVNFFLYPWANFDGIHYLLIAGEGYTNNFGFLPLFPILIKTLTLLIGNESTFSPSYFFSGLIISNLAFLASLFIFYKLLLFDYKRGVAITSIVFLLLFPTSFYFGAVYSESLFLLLTLLTFYFARRKWWLLAGLLGALTSATRVVGIILLPALLVEYAMQKKKTIKDLLSILLAPLGLIIYAVYNFVRWGNPLYFLQAQGELSNGRAVNSIILPPQLIYRYIKILFTVSPVQYDWWIALLEFGVFWFAAILVYVMWKQKIRLSYLIFAVLGILIPMMSGTLTDFPRYILPLFPLFIAISGVKNKVFQIVYVGISILLSFILLTLFARGYYVA